MIITEFVFHLGIIRQPKISLPNTHAICFFLMHNLYWLYHSQYQFSNRIFRRWVKHTKYW